MIQKLLDDHELEFDGYTDKCCISKTELSEILKEYAVLMCQRQREICAERFDFESEQDETDAMLSLFIENAESPEELQ